MGRHKKRVITNDGIDRRVNGYYSTPPFIAAFISNAMLEINPNGDSILDPCVGKEELLDTFIRKNKTVDSFDIEDFGINYKSNFQKKDFLAFYKELYDNNIFPQNIQLDYDYYIANPPYNCHETDYIRNNKNELKLLFSDIGVLNMYSMFVSALIKIAKPGAVIGLITNDSFLTARLHSNLRKQILNECSVKFLILCSTDLFWEQKADVRTCIFILQKVKDRTKKVKTLNRPINKIELENKLKNFDFIDQNIDELILQGKKDLKEFVIGCPKDTIDLFQYPRLSDEFRCVTGISTGNDKKYISKQKTEYFNVPFYKNPGTRRFYTELDGYLPEDFLEIEKKVSNFMVRNKDILFKEGITCSSMGVPFSACYLPPGATFGVNANIICNKKDIWWLISYLNSSLVTYFVRGILIRTNMITSGYVSRLPIIPLSEKQRIKLGEIALEAYGRIEKAYDRIKNYGHVYSKLISKIDEIVFESSGISNLSKSSILRFCSNLHKFT